VLKEVKNKSRKSSILKLKTTSCMFLIDMPDAEINQSMHALRNSFIINSREFTGVVDTQLSFIFV
jgi:hypothetical protein